MNKEKVKDIEKLKAEGAVIIADDKRLGVTIWEHEDMIFLMIKGVILPFTVKQFKGIVGLFSDAFLYLSSKHYHKTKSKHG